MLNMSMAKSLIRTVCPKGILITVTRGSEFLPLESLQIGLINKADGKQIFSTNLKALEDKVNG
jgi:hypothetical protein